MAPRRLFYGMIVAAITCAVSCSDGNHPSTGPRGSSTPPVGTSTPVSMAGTWVLSIDSMKTYIFIYVWSDCRTASGIVLHLIQKDSTVTGTWDHGLIVCPDTTETVLTGNDTIASGRVSGTTVNLTLAGIGLAVTGTIDTTKSRYTAAGLLDTTGSDYGIGPVLGGRWSATRRTPVSTLPIAYAASGSGQLDSVSVWIDGVQGLQVAPNSTYDVTNELAAGLHVLQGSFPYSDCKLAGSFSRYVQVNENVATPVVSYSATC